MQNRTWGYLFRCLAAPSSQRCSESLSDPLSVEPFIQRRTAWTGALNGPIQTDSTLSQLPVTVPHAEVVGSRCCRGIPQCHSLWPLTGRLHSLTHLIHVTHLVRITKMVLIISYLKPLHSLTPLDVGKPAGNPHKFSIYIRVASWEKQNDLYGGFFSP